MERLRELWKAILIVFILGWSSGCASYDTPQAADTATLTCSVKILKIFKVDKDRTWSWYHQGDGVSEVKLTPGKHTVAVHAFLGDIYASNYLWFVAEPRGRYEVHYRRNGMRVALWIIDTATGQMVGGIRGSDDEPPDTDEHSSERDDAPVLHDRQV